MLMTKLYRDFFSNQGDVTKICDPIETVFELDRDFIHAPLICKLQEVQKTEQVMLMTKLNRDFFSSQEEVTMIRSGQFLNLFELLFMSTL